LSRPPGSRAADLRNDGAGPGEIAEVHGFRRSSSRDEQRVTALERQQLIPYLRMLQSDHVRSESRGLRTTECHNVVIGDVRDPDIRRNRDDRKRK
jgi:hypothetical protein